MVGSFGFTFDIDDPRDGLDARVWRAVAMRLLARTGEGLVVCDGDLRVLHATPQALHLLGRIGTAAQGRLPAEVVRAVSDQIQSNDLPRGGCLLPAGGGASVRVDTALLPVRPPPHVALFLREEAARDELLYARLREELPITRRAFQLALLVRQGLTNRQIAERLNLTESTVKVYLHHLYRDCGVSSRTALVALLARYAR